MAMLNYKKRLMEENFQTVADILKIVLICGPRQCGKSTMMKHMFENAEAFISFDYPETAQYASDSPRSLLSRYLTEYGQIAIDEFQKVPQILGVMKAYADQMQGCGKIFLSGSSNFRALPSANESMAGRLGEVRLRTFTEAEKVGYYSSFFERLLNKDYGRDLPFSEANKNVILQRALCGGYPAVSDKMPKLRREWFRNYLKALVEKDLSDLGSFRKKDAMNIILQTLGNYSSRLINFSEIAQATDLDMRTVKNYVQALQSMYLIDEVPSWKKHGGIKFASQSKWFMTDTGLMSAVQGHSDFEVFFEWLLKAGKKGTDFVGNLVETFVYTQLIPCVELKNDWQMYHVRSAQKYEIDFLLEHESGQKIAIEVKASESVSLADFKNIDWFQKLNPNESVRGVVLYCGNEVREYDNGYVALPIAKFWQD